MACRVQRAEEFDIVPTKNNSILWVGFHSIYMNSIFRSFLDANMNNNTSNIATVGTFYFYFFIYILFL